MKFFSSGLLLTYGLVGRRPLWYSAVMTARTVLEHQWPYLLSFLPPGWDEAALAHGALRRKREVGDAAVLLRLALAYGFCGLSLRQTTAWATAAEIASLSDVALLKRLRHCADWLGHLLGRKLAERATPPLLPTALGQVRLVDATVISAPGSTGTDWRIHLRLSLSTLTIDQIELTDARGGESLKRFRFVPGELVIGDRGYAHRPGLHAVGRSGAEFLIRLNWQTVPLQQPTGEPFELLSALRGLPEAEAGRFAVQVAPDARAGLPALPAALVAVRKTETAAQEARQKILREHQRKGQTTDPRTLEAAAYVFALTSIADPRVSAQQLLEAYRFRWQIEMAFKRLKGLLELGVLPAKDPHLARVIIAAKLLAALLLEDFTSEFLAVSPWGFPLRGQPPVAVAHSTGAGR